MTLQQTLDMLKRNDQGALFRKDRQMVFRAEDGDNYRPALVTLDDEGTIVVELVPDLEESASEAAAIAAMLADGGEQ